MNKIQTFFVRAFEKNSLIHGAYMAGIGTVSTTILPTLTQLYNGQTPTLAILGHTLTNALIVGFSAALIYICKNGLAGGSTATTTPVTPVAPVIQTTPESQTK